MADYDDRWPDRDRTWRERPYAGDRSGRGGRRYRMRDQWMVDDDEPAGYRDPYGTEPYWSRGHPGAYGPYGLGREGYGRYGYGRSGGGHWRDEDERGFFDRAGDEIASWFGDEDAERRRRMDAREGRSGAQHHRGRGPRGYTRSDERIRDDVNDRLTDDWHLDASDIEVSVSGGEVTLSGYVASRGDKRRAEDIADNVSGARHVQNNLRVREAGHGGETAVARGPTSAEVSRGVSEGRGRRPTRASEV